MDADLWYLVLIRLRFDFDLAGFYSMTVSIGYYTVFAKYFRLNAVCRFAVYSCRVITTEIIMRFQRGLDRKIPHE